MVGIFSGEVSVAMTGSRLSGQEHIVNAKLANNIIIIVSTLSKSIPINIFAIQQNNEKNVNAKVNKTPGLKRFPFE